MQVDVIDVGLKDDQIMQRYLIRRIFHEFELRIVETDGTTHVGFITGFDDRCLQISTTPAHEAEEPKAMLIFWPVRRIEETGSRIDCLAPDHRKKIRSYGHALRAQCEAVLNRGGTANNVSPIGKSNPQTRMSAL
jgi:hypothetical protein